MTAPAIATGYSAAAIRRAIARHAALGALVVVAAVAATLAPVTARAQAAEKAQSLPTIPLVVGGRKVVAEVARAPAEMATGLMWRFSLRPDHGMLFVYDQPRHMSFWMRNTFIPLSIAFIAADGRILNIADMAPQDESLHWSKGPALYALEMRKGWFAERGIRAGDAVKGLPEPKR